ncbi:MAG: hypothetical protein QOG65_3425 [Actinomycetota bacterium]|jgi:hypothetical protein|nr:hypothetical protein [Actinomycetota bacterium]
MIAAQVGCSVATAEVLLSRRAELIGCDPGQIATAVVDRRIRFERPAPPRESHLGHPRADDGYSTGVTSTMGSRQWRGASGTSPSGAEYSTSCAPQTMHR